MKFFLIILFLILNFKSFANAEQYGEIEIEGILLKESLLKYFDKNEIEKKKKRGFIYPKNDFYSVTFSSPKFKKYDNVQFHIKAEDKKYIIQSLTGQVDYINNINQCYQDMDNIVSEIKSIFNNPQVVDLGIEGHTMDQESKVKTTFIDLISTNYQEAAIVIECYNWSEKQTKQNGRKDHLSISVDSRDFEYWINNVAFK